MYSTLWAKCFLISDPEWFLYQEKEFKTETNLCQASFSGTLCEMDSLARLLNSNPDTMQTLDRKSESQIPKNTDPESESIQ